MQSNLCVVFSCMAKHCYPLLSFPITQYSCLVHRPSRDEHQDVIDGHICHCYSAITLLVTIQRGTRRDETEPETETSCLYTWPILDRLFCRLLFKHGTGTVTATAFSLSNCQDRFPILVGIIGLDTMTQR